MSLPKTVVIACAGIGSRLGLEKPKALIDVLGRPLIHWQLEMLEEVEDLRIVVGYKYKELMKTVLQIRKDVTFVFNHDYFHTKTATSVFLGGLNGSSRIFVLDGDMLIHPEDLQDCLQSEEMFIGYSENVTEDGVFVELDGDNITLFTRDQGIYEWVGPAYLDNDMFTYASDKHIYQIIEPRLPIKGKRVRAIDIDTPSDYQNALAKFKQWINWNDESDIA